MRAYKGMKKKKEKTWDTVKMSIDKGKKKREKRERSREINKTHD